MSEVVLAAIKANLPRRGMIFEPWPHEPPEGWPYQYVAAVDFAALLAEIERLEAQSESHLDAYNALADKHYALASRLAEVLTALDQIARIAVNGERKSTDAVWDIAAIAVGVLDGTRRSAGR